MSAKRTWHGCIRSIVVLTDRSMIPVDIGYQNSGHKMGLRESKCFWYGSEMQNFDQHHYVKCIQASQNVADRADRWVLTFTVSCSAGCFCNIQHIFEWFFSIWDAKMVPDSSEHTSQTAAVLFEGTKGCRSGRVHGSSRYRELNVSEFFYQIFSLRAKGEFAMIFLHEQILESQAKVAEKKGLCRPYNILPYDPDNQNYVQIQAMMRYP